MHDLIVPELLELETAVEWVRPMDLGYRYVREIVITFNPSGALPDAYNTIAAPMEIVGFALLHPHKAQGWKPGRRRAWVLWHQDGLDGLDWPAAVHPDNTDVRHLIVDPSKVRAREFSTPLTEPKDVDDVAIQRATMARERALEYWRAWEIDQAERREVRRVFDERKAREAVEQRKAELAARHKMDPNLK